MDETITGPLKVAQSMGFAGMGLLAAVLALWVVAQLVPVFKTQLSRRNGNGGSENGGPRGMKLECPMASGKRTLDDVYGALVDLKRSVEDQTKRQDQIISGQERVVDRLHEFTLEVARRGGLSVEP